MSILRIAGTAVSTLFVTVTLALTAAGPAAAAPANSGNLTLVPAEITLFDWRSGKQQWTQPSRNRLSRAVFTLRADGAFVMHQPDSYPTLVGTVSSDGTVRAAYHSTTGNTGSISVEVLGQLGVDNGVPVLSLTYASGSAMAAVINGTRFGSNSTLMYRATMTLRSA
ncbi:MAG: hypothetical protein ACRDRH_07265 [Pseudonocardia sp.]